MAAFDRVLSGIPQMDDNAEIGPANHLGYEKSDPAVRTSFKIPE